MITTILFDLDGTLVPLSGEDFQEQYFKLLTGTMKNHGYIPEELIKWVWAGTKEMMKNHGIKTNYQVFWEKFSQLSGRKADDIPIFDQFYLDEFDQIGELIPNDFSLREFFDDLHSKNYRLVLATNPFFPINASITRLKWLGLSTEDFAYITTMENSSFTKPNPKYYEAIFEKIGAVPEECIMVGNNPTEDMCAEALGCKVFLMTDFIENRENVDYSGFAQGGFKELKDFIFND